jgi:PD-(D/E)XK nuclease superfamily
VKFNELDHSYFNNEGDKYLSATSFIKMFCTPFDRDKRAKAYAKKHKRKVDEVIEEWEKAGQIGRDKGTFYHKLKEDELTGEDSVLVDEEDYKIFKPIWEDGIKIHESQKLEPGVYPELIVWSDKYKIAGQADRVEITKKGYINIDDYKTSKEIKKESFKKWDGSPTMMKFPLSNLEDCNFNQYSLQINLYSFLIKQQNRGLKIGRMMIEHVVGDIENGEFIVKQVYLHEVPNLQDEIKLALEYYKNK